MDKNTIENHNLIETEAGMQFPTTEQIIESKPRNIDLDAQREEFEKTITTIMNINNPNFKSDENGGYEDWIVDVAWEIWKTKEERI